MSVVTLARQTAFVTLLPPKFSIARQTAFVVIMPTPPTPPSRPGPPIGLGLALAL